jgi:hypothetical protein
MLIVHFFLVELRLEPIDNLTATGGYMQGVHLTLATHGRVSIPGRQLLLNVSVTDTAQHVAYARVRLVLDADAPFEPLVWSSDSYAAQISDGCHNGTLVVRVSAQCAVGGVRELRYRLVQPNPFYRIDDQTGDLFTNDCLDEDAPMGVTQKLQR